MDYPLFLAVHPKIGSLSIEKRTNRVNDRQKASQALRWKPSDFSSLPRGNEAAGSAEYLMVKGPLVSAKSAVTLRYDAAGTGVGTE
jgi:hypothetical protein